MNERERKIGDGATGSLLPGAKTTGSRGCDGASGRRGQEDPREQRLRALYTAVYPPNYPSVKPSEGLRQRVGEVMARSDARAARRGPWWLPLPIRSVPALGAVVGAVLIAVLGLALARRGHDASRLFPAPLAASRPHVGQVPVRPHAARPRPERDPGRQMAALPRSIQPSVTRNEGARARRHTSLPVAPRRGASPTVARDDLGALNGDAAQEVRRWVALSSDEWDEIEARVRRTVRAPDDFIQIPFPRLASASERQIAEAVESYKREAAIVDARLAREVALQQKATALTDLCDRLRADTGIHLVAGSSVADEKVTLFCRKLPLRDVMRQLSRPFGYAWLRSGKTGEYRYELVQDLRSQLMEEELRNRDRSAALLALEREIERYRPYLALSPDEVRARARTASPAEKVLQEKLAGQGWGPIHLYFRLPPGDLAALRAGQELKLSAAPENGERPLPPEVARGVLQSLPDWRLRKVRDVNLGNPGEVFQSVKDTQDSSTIPLTAAPEIRALVTLTLNGSVLGRLALGGNAGYVASVRPGRPSPDTSNLVDDDGLAVGNSASIREPEARDASTRAVHDPALRVLVTVRPQPSCAMGAVANAAGASAAPRVTAADVLAALHQATGLPIVSDAYTRLFPPEEVTLRNVPLQEALDRLADTMRLRWKRETEGGWLQVRSIRFYNDRINEVPNRLLTRWQASRQQHGALTLEDMVEIAQLPDGPLENAEMADGARGCWGLAEWDLARSRNLRPHLRFLGQFTPAQRQDATSPAGLPFIRMPLAQQQRFLALAFPPEMEGLRSLEELTGAVLRVDYSLPGWYEWRVPGPAGYWLQWVMPAGPGRRAPRPPVRERTREAALQAARQISPQLREAMLQASRRLKPDFGEQEMVPQETQIHPTTLDLTVLYIPGASHARPLHWANSHNTNTNGTW